MEELDQTGEWWVPGARYDSVAGTLTYSPSDGIRIAFLDTLPVPEDWNGRIFGVSEDDQYTLRDCEILPVGEGLSPDPRGAIPQSVLVGDHIYSKQSYDQVCVRFSGLNRWACDSICQDREVSEDGEEVTYKFDRTVTTLAQIEHNNDEIHLRSGFKINETPCEGISKINDPFFQIDSSSNPLDYYNEYISELQRLISLGLNDPVHPERITARGDSAGGSGRVEVQVLRLLSQYHEQDPSPHNYHFTSVEADLEPILQNWFDGLDDGKILRNLYFGVRYSDSMFESNRLLSFVSAIESYHDRALFPEDTCIPEDEFEPIKGEIQDIASGTGLEDRMNGLIGHVINDVSIKDKILKFMMEYSNIYKSLSEEEDYNHIEVINETARDAAAARHAVAHGTGELDRDVLGVGGVSDWLRLGIEACLLDMLGIDQERIVNQLRINYRIRLEEVTLPPIEVTESIGNSS